MQAAIWTKGMGVKVEHKKRRDLVHLFGENVLPV